MEFQSEVSVAYEYALVATWLCTGMDLSVRTALLICEFVSMLARVREERWMDLYAFVSLEVDTYTHARANRDIMVARVSCVSSETILILRGRIFFLSFSGMRSLGRG